MTVHSLNSATMVGGAYRRRKTGRRTGRRTQRRGGSKASTRRRRR